MPRVGRRHSILGIRLGDLFDQQAVRRVARLDDPFLEEHALLRVEMKFRLTLLLVRTMTCETVVGQNRQDLAVETDGRWRVLTLGAHGRSRRNRDGESTDEGR